MTPHGGEHRPENTTDRATLADVKASRGTETMLTSSSTETDHKILSCAFPIAFLDTRLREDARSFHLPHLGTRNWAFGHPPCGADAGPWWGCLHKARARITGAVQRRATSRDAFREKNVSPGRTSSFPKGATVFVKYVFEP